MNTYPQRLGKYELQERLDRGGMNEVWKAFDIQLQRSVAVKLFHPSMQADPDFDPDKFIARFLQEVPQIAALDHPNIVPVHDFQVSRPPKSKSAIPHLVMDYIEGPTLADYIGSISRGGNFLSASSIVDLFTSISIAVDYAHHKRIIHRNLKPGNILLDKRAFTVKPQPGTQSLTGRPMLTGFGIAELLRDTTGRHNKTASGNTHYIAPEQIQGYAGNEYSDLYALGCILYEVCTGVPPFQGDNPNSIIMQHINAIPAPPAAINRNIPPPLTVVILRSLAKDPAARFVSASALTAAIAEALDQPVPESLKASAYPTDSMNEPTFYKAPGTPALSSSREPIVIPSSSSSPSLPVVRTSTPPPHTDVSLPQFTASQLPTATLSDNGQSQLQTPNASTMSPGSIARTAPVTHLIENIPTLVVPPPHVKSPPAPSSFTPRKRWSRTLVLAIVLLIIVIAGALLGTLYLIPGSNPTPPIVGQASFISSGQTNENSTRGLNDELLLNLHNVPDLAVGKSYYGWLLGDKGQAGAITLGRLTISKGNGQVLYIDPQHNNLLATMSRLLVTEENGSDAPPKPSSDQSTWRYYAELPQITNSTDAHHYSTLDYLRHLLSGDPRLDALGLPGGQALWLFRNTEKILDWSASARDDWSAKSTGQMHAQLVTILDYLDGKAYLQTDVPGTPVIVNKAEVALLQFNQQNPPGYLALINQELQSIVNAPGLSPDKRLFALKISQDLNDVTGWLKQVHDDAKQLLNMTSVQLLSPSSLSILDNMETQAFFAYAGRLDPATNKMQRGVAEIHYDIQRLATFDITQYKSS